MNQSKPIQPGDILDDDEADNLSRSPDLKDLISTDEASRLQDRSFDEIVDLKKSDEVDDQQAGGQDPSSHRENPENLQSETESSILRADYGDQD